MYQLALLASQITIVIPVCQLRQCWPHCIPSVVSAVCFCNNFNIVKGRCFITTCDKLVQAWHNMPLRSLLQAQS